MDHFGDRLVAAVRARGNAVVVGIDPRTDSLPERLRESTGGVVAAVAAFGRGVIDVVATLVPAVKLQSAFYEALGPNGPACLFETAAYARERGLIVIVDGKRNDIGSTADAYARAYVGKESPGDALTVNPYLGEDGIAPFVKTGAREGRGLFVLVRTSNPSAGQFQDLVADGKPVYRHVADRVAEWAAPQRGRSGYSLVGAVVGATYPEQLAELRAALPGVFFLVPGYGSQGGTARDVARAFDADGLGALVNSSRGVTNAYERPEYRSRFGDNWQAAVEQAARDMIADLAAHIPGAKAGGRN